ncbi:penicillin-binding protein 1A/1B [Lentibacillus populi]|uniref:Penicillin-binding protein 1A/1B n=1 Tax=Lentibacillus populi TaxID=1827502 RepID=A0A9W5TUY6_9BACI|nr:PBP1A family penicillin-binding protein [Lentibacillus populi]MBT2214233.1 PBP1A family penicillin-binding protein [Virgibacillus dakarensis]GGB33188.1 penicillin-binding protein 1A/1B [Lentibacillus populi]
MAENSQSRVARRKQKKAKKKPLWKRILLYTGIAILAMVIGVGAMFTYFIATAPKLDAAKLQDPFSSKIYDMDGELFADLGAEQRTKVNYDDLPKVLIDAVTATEDSRFFQHHGVDPVRVGGAIVANIKHGFGSEGASTITQQVVEQAFLSHEKKISLKVQEMWLALQLERDYSKEEILEMYLNKVYYGSGAYGVAKAAQIYFGKTDLKELTLPEAAILAGLPQRPSAYNPYQSPDLTKGRMDTVLKLMVKHGKITQKQADEARKVDIPSLLTDSHPDSTPYEAFLQKVRKEVEKKIDGADIYTDGLKIYTTIDKDIQEHVEFLLSDEEDNPIQYPEKVEDPKTKKMVDMQAGMVVLDSKNGAIRAIGGARGGLENDGFNYAIGTNRQAGSTMKPILAYGPAIEYEKWSTYHQMNDDKPYQIPGSDKKVGNWNGQYQGWMSIRKALEESLNVPAMKTVEEVGQGNAQKFAEGLGIKFDKDMIGTDTIGGGELGVSPLELAGAYRAFANEGISSEPYSVTKVEYPDGRTVDLKPKQKPVMSDYTAYMMSDMLKTAITSGTGKLADVPGLPVVGKTGTTNRPGVEGSPDSWFSGYTTNYTISVWTGYNNNDIGLSGDNTKIPHALFKNTMSHISDGIETADFKKPDSVVEVGVEKGSNPAKLPSAYTPDSNIVTELFVKGTEPTKTSEKYDKLDPVSGLTAEYDKDKNKINVKWDYDKDQDVSFQVSASVDGGQMQELSTTGDTSMEISSVEPGSEYTIQVVAISNENEETSEAKSTTVTVPGEGEDDEDNEENQGEMEPVSGLKATYKNNTIDVSWKYNGPAAVFEVTVSGDGSQQQTVNSNGIKIDNAQPGRTYTISVTPVGKNGDTQGARGEPQSTTITIPGEEAPPGDDGDGNEDGNNGEQGGGQDGSENEQGEEEGGEPEG